MTRSLTGTTTRRRWGFVVAVAAFVLLLSLSQPPGRGGLAAWLPAFDFGVLAVVLAAAVGASGRSPVETAAIAAGGTIVYAVAIEATQWAFAFGRVGTIDVLAGAVGAVAGVGLWWVLAVGRSG